MKTIHVCESVIGGTGTHLNELFPLLEKMGRDDSFALLVPRQHVDHLPDVSATAIIPYHRPNRWIGILTLTIATTNAILRFRPDIIHAHSTFAGVVVRLLGFIMGVATVYCPHGWASDRAQTTVICRLISFIEKTLAKQASRIIAISDHECRKALSMGISQEKIETIYNGLRDATQTALPISWTDARLKVLFVGRLDHQKGVDILLNAAQPLSQHVVVRIIGDVVVGKEKPAFVHASNIEELGWLPYDEVANHMAACDVVVVPSRWEGFGYVALEAMRAAKPIIVSSVGGLPEFVKEGVNGYVFPAGDSHALAQILLHLNRAALPAMGKAGHKMFIEKYTAERMAEKVLALYAEIEHHSKAAPKVTQ